MKVKARISKTNRFREVTLRRDPNCKNKGANPDLYGKTPAYIHCGRSTVSGYAKETDWDKWVFVPTGKNRDLLY